jgi:hypothetical protein
MQQAAEGRFRGYLFDDRDGPFAYLHEVDPKRRPDMTDLRVHQHLADGRLAAQDRLHERVISP